MIAEIVFARDSKEWVLVELQGSVTARNKKPLAGSLLGDLHVGERDHAVLIIGSQRLEGKIVELKAPMAVIEKVNAAADEKDGDVQWKVVGVIRRKALFSVRPAPIVKKRKR